MLREKLRNKKGFTLIEIIVVIVILAVLMAVAVPSVMSYMNEGQKARYQAVARTVLINAQTEYANKVADVADDNKANVINDTQTAVQGKNYGDGVEVSDVHITLTDKGNSDADKDVATVTCKIKIGDKTRGVKIDANKKVDVS